MKKKNGNANLKRIKETNKSNNCLQSQMKLTPLQQSNNYNTVSPWMLITLSKRIKFLLYFSFLFVYVCLFEWRKSHLKSKKNARCVAAKKMWIIWKDKGKTTELLVYKSRASDFDPENKFCYSGAVLSTTLDGIQLSTM